MNFSKQYLHISHATLYDLIIWGTVLLFLLPLLAGCTPQDTTANLLPTKRVVEDNLPVVLRWSQQVGSYASPLGTPLDCHEDLGVMLSRVDGPDAWQGLVLFNSLGTVLWNHPAGKLARDVALDEHGVYIFNPPIIRAYSLDSGMEIWETDEGLFYRVGASYLIPEDSTLLFLANKQINSYSTHSGSLIAKESIPTENLVLRYDGLDFYSGNGYTLYATVTGDQNQFLWQAPYNIIHRPHVHEDNLIVQIRGTGNVCSLELKDGQTNWCTEQELNSNIAIHNGLAYGIDGSGNLTTFRLADGVGVGQSALRSPNNNSTRGSVAACEEHLLVYLTLPDEIFWFDFLQE